MKNIFIVLSLIILVKRTWVQPQIADDYKQAAQAYCRAAAQEDDVCLINNLGRSWNTGDTPIQSIRATSNLQPLIDNGNFGAADARPKPLGFHKSNNVECRKTDK